VSVSWPSRAFCAASAPPWSSWSSWRSWDVPKPSRSRKPDFDQRPSTRSRHTDVMSTRPSTRCDSSDPRGEKSSLYTMCPKSCAMALARWTNIASSLRPDLRRLEVSHRLDSMSSVRKVIGQKFGSIAGRVPRGFCSDLCPSTAASVTPSWRGRVSCVEA